MRAYTAAAKEHIRYGPVQIVAACNIIKYGFKFVQPSLGAVIFYQIKIGILISRTCYGITAAANGGENIAGVLLEDPPVFSTDGEGWEQSFAYLDTYRTIHEYNASDKSECWEAFYLRRCLWGRLYMADAMPKIADYAQSYRDKHPGEEVKIFFMPSSAVLSFHYAADYDLNYGEHFYDLSWNNGITHEELLKGINVPCVYLHAKESIAPDGTYLCAASREQAERAVRYIGDNAKLIETEDSSHAIHTAHSGLYIDALNSLLPER